MREFASSYANVLFWSKLLATGHFASTFIRITWENDRGFEPRSRSPYACPVSLASFRALLPLHAIGMRAHTGEFAALHDQILIANRTVLEVTLEDFPGARCVARLR
jgi:hypothetical protein